MVFRVHVKFGESDDGKVIATLRFDSLSLCFLSLYLRYSLCTVIFTLFCVQTCLLFLVQDVEVTAFDSVECRVIHNSVFSIN